MAINLSPRSQSGDDDDSDDLAGVLTSTITIRDDDDDLDQSLSSRSADTSYSASSFKSDYSLGKDELEEWTSGNVRGWLAHMDLEHYFKVFRDNGWDQGAELTQIKQSEFIKAAQTVFTNDEKMTKDVIKLDVKTIFREIEKLQVNEYDDVADAVLTVEDIFEFERRLARFTRKWERIAWISEYVEDWDGRLPTTDVLEEELDVPYELSVDLLSTYNQKVKEEEIDLNKLFEGFNISDHGVIWWSIVLDKLQTQVQDSLWTILRFVLRELSTKICIYLLEHFKFELSKFESIEIDKLCQAIVFGSLYPMCTAIRLSGYMSENAERDLSRSNEFTLLGNDYAKLAIHLLKEYTESDHLAAVLLEMESDIDGLSAIDLAIKYKVIKFVSNKRIERISNTLFRQWRFLHTSNKDESFKVRPLTMDEFYDLLSKQSFYFTPLGQFTTEVSLFIMFLGIFTIITREKWTVYEAITPLEAIFWIANWGYILFEIWDAYSSVGGFRGYIADWTNKIDMLIVLDFIAMMGLRSYALIFYTHCSANSTHWSYNNCSTETEEPEESGCHPNTMDSSSEIRCINSNCCIDSTINVVFFVLWSTATICLWFRVLQLFLINRKVGPFVNMILNMTSDFKSFINIYGLFWLGAVYALLFVASGDIEMYDTEWAAIVTTFKAALGEFPADDISGNVSAAREVVITCLVIWWMTIGAIVLLNLLIALMAKTFDDLSEQNNQQVQFANITRAYSLDSQIAVMPPPMNLAVFATVAVIEILDILSTVFFQLPIPARLFMPHWLREEGKEGNVSGTDAHSDQFDSKQLKLKMKSRFTGCCGRCKRAWFIKYQQQKQKYDWVCKYCRQRTVVDYSKHVDASAMHISYSDLVSEKELEMIKLSSQNLDPVQRLGDRLGLDKDEVVNVRRLQPTLCQRCYRRRKPISRFQMQMEFVSYWYFHIFFRYPLKLLIGIVTYTVAFLRMDIIGRVLKEQGAIKSEIRVAMKCKYDADVLKVMPSSKEMKRLFSDNTLIWYLVSQSKYEITPRTVRRVVDRQILKRAYDRDYELHQFYNKVCGKHKFLSAIRKKRIHKGARNEREEWKKIEYAANLWFKVILNNTRDNIHLSHTKLFPFSAKLIQQHIESTLNETVMQSSSSNLKGQNHFDMDKFDENHLKEFLPLLYVDNKKEQNNVISSLKTFALNNTKFLREKGQNACLWDCFIYFLFEVRRLTATVRRIENMIRDVEDAAKAHGNDAEIYLSHFHLVFEDIQNDAVATVIFRSIDQDNESVPYWKVRNFLVALKQMRRNVDRELLEKSRYTQVSREEFLDIVLRRVKARDDDSDDDDASDDDKMRDDTEDQQKQIRGIREEGDKIFTRIWIQNELKITLTQIREYASAMPAEMKNINIIKFVKQRLEKRVKEHTNKNPKLSFAMFQDILQVRKSEFLKYRKMNANQSQKQITVVKFTLNDEDDCPAIPKPKAIYNELLKIFDLYENPDRPDLTLIDAYNIIFIATLMYPRIRNEIKSRGHDLELTQELFVKTMEKAVYFDKNNDFDYKRPFEEWTDVARQSASIFQQVHDEEQGHVTLGQVRETLMWIENDLVSLCSMSKLKKKLLHKRKMDQMVDQHRWWSFLVNELGVEDDKKVALQRQARARKKSTAQTGSNEEYSSSSESDSDDGRIKRATTEMQEMTETANMNSKFLKRTASKKNVENANENEKLRSSDDFGKRRITNYARANRVFDLIENQNGLWITMRQIHVYISWLHTKLEGLDMDWNQYLNNKDRINEKEFKRIVLASAYDFSDRDLKELVQFGIEDRMASELNLADQVDLTDDDIDEKELEQEDLKYDDAMDEVAITELELARLKKLWKGDPDLRDDRKLFSAQLSWIFKRCAIIDVATDTRASWYHICKFIQGFRDGSIEKRVRHDLKFLTGNHQVYRDEFEQFKATLKCRGDAAISLFYQIRHFCESINWAQISEFLEFLHDNLGNVEFAIDQEPMGEDEDPTVEELIPLMRIPSEVDGNWLFSIVIQRHSSKVSWTEIREYLIDWNEQRDEVTDFFEELIEKRDREKLTEKSLDDITSKIDKVRKYFDVNTSVQRDELNRKSKGELIEYITQSEWYMNKNMGMSAANQSGFKPRHSVNKSGTQLLIPGMQSQLSASQSPN